MRQHRTLAITFALALLCTPLYAAQPGVGLPGTPANFNRHWCQESRPGGCSELAPADFDCSICPRNGWTGWYAEKMTLTQKALRTCWEIDYWGTKAQYTGQYTEPEFSWAQVAGMSKTSGMIRKCYYESHANGGSPERAIVYRDDNTRWHNKLVMAEAKRQGAWKSGLFNYRGYDPIRGIWTSGSVGSWPVWVDNQLTGEAPQPPTPTPTPQPTPTPTPPPQPAPTPVPASCCPAGESCSAPCPQPSPCPSCPPAIVLPPECAPIAAVRESADVIARNVFTAQRRRQRVADCIKAIERTFALRSE